MEVNDATMATEYHSIIGRPKPKSFACVYVRTCVFVRKGT